MAPCCFLASFPVACSVCFLTNPRTTCLGMALPTGSWALPHQSLNKKRLHRPAYRPMTAFVLRNIPSSQIHRGSCQVDRNNQHTTRQSTSSFPTSSPKQDLPFLMASIQLLRNSFALVVLRIQPGALCTAGQGTNELHSRPFYNCCCCF